MKTVVRKRVYEVLFFCLMGAIGFFPTDTFCADTSGIVVINSKEIVQYNLTLFNFEEELAREGYNILKKFSLDKTRGKEPQVVNEIKTLNPALIFTIGTEATLFAEENFRDTAIVFSMVLNPVKNKVVDSLDNPGGKITGVSLDISPDRQFMKLKEIMPRLKSIGVIYDEKKGDFLTEIESAAKKLDLIVIAKSIQTESDVPDRVAQLSKEADCLWAQVDSRIYNAQSFQYILLTLVKSKIPLIAFSSQYVKAGALFALESDYANIGRQSGEIVAGILSGSRSFPIPIASPVKLRLIINKKIADFIGVDIPEKIIQEASDVYE